VKVVHKTDLWVGLFLVLTVGVIVGGLIATSGWGIRRNSLYIRADDVQDVAIDTKIYYQGLAVGRVAAINPHPSRKAGQLEFILRASMIEKFDDTTRLELPCPVDVEVVSGLLGGATMELHVDREENTATRQRCGSRAMLDLKADTIPMHHRPAVGEAFAGLATDLKSTLADAINATTNTVNAYRRLADSLSRTTSSARGFIEGIRPGTEQTLSEATANLARVRRLLDTADVRTGATMHQADLTMQQTRATMEQARVLMGSADSLTKLITAMGGENRPELRAMLLDARFLTQQLQYVMEQLSRRPMRAMSGVQLPESLTAEGRAKRMRADSVRVADSLEAVRRAPRDTTPVRRP
jgi:ABC-type transporter Mla subunit MlaD